MRRYRRATLSSILALGAGCASQPSSSSGIAPSVASVAPNPSARSDIRALSIAPASARVCPGDVIAAQYVAKAGDGSRFTLSRRDLASLVLSGVAAVPRPSDGGWETSAEPIVSVVSGFRLSAALAADTTLHADTVVAPIYDCIRASFVVPAGDEFQTSATYVRLGTFATPFHDSVVVAVVEVTNRAPIVTVLGPAQMHAAAIKISAIGKAGRPGGSGRAGADGTSCNNGEDGGDGGDGSDGQPGGRVDIIVQSDATWLAKLVAVSNTGGLGGAPGPGGRGGRASSASRQADRACASRAGRNGNPGRRGADGPAGLPPKVTSVPLPLLWSGSPIWSDNTARQALEALMAYEAKRNRH